MAVNINVPSQVKTYANLAAFPATGALKTIYIAEDTNKTYRWTGSVYVEVSASASGITIGTTAIASGVVGRVLFEGAGNVVQESANFFWDNTGFLGIGTSTPVAPSTYNGITINSATAGSYVWFQTGGVTKYSVGSEGNVNYHNLVAGTSFLIRSGGSSYFNVVQSTGNVQIGTTTDAGFRLDVNGNSRVRGAGATGSTNAFTVQNSASSSALSITNGLTTIVHGDLQLENTVLYWSSGSQIRNISNGVLRITNSSNSDFTRLQFGGGTTSFPSLQRSGSALAVMDATGTALTNLLVGTTTDAGFRLDVNGTARVGSSAASGQLYIKGAAGTGQYLYLDNGGTDLWTIIGGSVFVIDSSATRIFRANSNAQVTINGSSVDASSQLQVDSTTRGFLPPRMTTTQKNAIATPAAGLVVYDTTLNKLCVYTTAWETVTSL